LRGPRRIEITPDEFGIDFQERATDLLGKGEVDIPVAAVVMIIKDTADAAGLCLKSGNAAILRGGKEALNSNRVIAEIMVEAAQQEVGNFPRNAIQVVPTTDREAIRELLALTQYIDLCMPRGGEGLIRAVAECSKVPVLKHYKGVCHVYVDAGADLNMAEEIVMNAKCQRPAVCNAMETLLVDQAIAVKFLPVIDRRLAEKKVALRADDATSAILQPATCHLQPATEEDWFTEYNDYILNVRVVDGVQQAIDHINHYGSAHSDSIVTTNEDRARQFLAEVDSEAVYWNASTRFTDGAEFGFGAEIGISTQKLHARGPMALRELTTYKYVVWGDGQIRD